MGDIAIVRRDVLIMGGGVQALWLLNELPDTLSVVMLARGKLGAGQTGHSHGFIHQGHIFAHGPASPAKRLKEAHSFWMDWLAKHPAVRRWDTQFYIGLKAEKAPEFLANCNADELAIPCEEARNIPAVFQDGAEIDMFCCAGTHIDCDSLVRELAGTRSGEIGHCASLEILEVNASDVIVRAEIGDREFVDIQAQFVVLACGTGNQELIDSFALQSGMDEAERAQQDVKTYMLVLEGETAALEELSGLFPSFNGMFIVHRELGDGRTVWLIGDKQRPILLQPGDHPGFDAAAWFCGLKPHLDQLAPKLFRNPDEFRWGIYEARKAEGWNEGKMPSGYRIHSCNHPRIRAVWPTLLTLAPLASRELAEYIRKTVTTPYEGPDAGWRGLGPVPKSAGELWTHTDLLGWNEFRKEYAVPC